MTNNLSSQTTRKNGILDRLGHARALELSQSVRLTAADVVAMTFAQMKSLRAQGIWKLILDTDVSLDGENALSNAEFLAIICMLRDATRLGLRVDWRLGDVPEYVLPHLCHLTPPDTSSSPDNDLLSRPQPFSFGQFFWKKGPDFAIVIDRRIPGKNHKFVISGEDALTTFLRLADGRPHIGTADLDRESMETLERAGIVLRLGTRSIIVPYRLSHPPVPSYAIENI